MDEQAAEFGRTPRRPEAAGQTGTTPVNHPSTPRPGGLLARVQGVTEDSPEKVTQGLLARLQERYVTRRESCDLTLVLTAAPHFFQAGNFLQVVTDGARKSCAKNQLSWVDPADAALLVLDQPRASVQQAAGDHQLPGHALLLSPKLERYYRFEQLSVIGYHREHGTGQLPIVRVTCFPYLEGKLRPAAGVLGRLHNLMRTKEFFQGCLDSAVADIAALAGGSAYRVSYWLDRDASSGSAPPPFDPARLDYVWSGDAQSIADQLADSFEIGLEYVPAMR